MSSPCWCCFGFVTNSTSEFMLTSTLTRQVIVEFVLSLACPIIKRPQILHRMCMPPTHPLPRPDIAHSRTHAISQAGARSKQKWLQKQHSWRQDDRTHPRWPRELPPPRMIENITSTPHARTQILKMIHKEKQTCPTQ